jgi:nucleoside-diphosphate-sugar epimerase
MKVLFIGGTGIISSACTRLAVEMGVDLYLLNRGNTFRDIPTSVNLIKGDIRDWQETQKVLSSYEFDVVVDWIAFNTEHIQVDIDLFSGKTRQFIFISSASVYDVPKSYPVSEDCRVYNPFWDYSHKKIACEELLIKEFKENEFPATIVRPSHTYDQTMFPISGGYTIIDRMLRNEKVIVHGDGTSLWTLTHHEDFARGFIPLLGNMDALGEDYHITSNEWLSWNRIFEMMAEAFGTKAKIVHIPSDYINQHDPEWGAGLLGDKATSMIFDNAKIKKLVPDFEATIPFSEGAKQIAKWYNADPGRKIIDQQKNEVIDQILASYLD